MMNACSLELLLHICADLRPGPRRLVNTSSNTFLIVASREMKNYIAVVAKSGFCCPWTLSQKTHRIVTNSDSFTCLSCALTEINDLRNRSVFWIVEMSPTSDEWDSVYMLIANLKVITTRQK